MSELLNRSRQYDIFRPEQALSGVTVIGVGGIGSPTVLALAKMGAPRIKVYDFDTVEEHNLPNQFYRHADLGRPKVEALADMVREFADGQLEPVNAKYVDQPLDGVVIASVDSIDMRREIWQYVKFNPSVELLIDARMGGEVAVLHTVRPCDPDDIEAYEASLFTAEQAAQLPCTSRAIIYNTFGIASVVCAAVRRWWVSGDRTPVFRMDFGSNTFM